MNFFARMSPLRAVRDLRLFLAQRQPYELVFLLISILVTGVILIGFVKDSHIEKEYRPKIIYVQQWRLDRTDAEIRAQQAIDGPIKQKAIDVERKRREARQAQFKRIDDKLNQWGL
ncbi:hypothetical protein F1C10_08680 [Sphingomonas sp. NBWT7]|uniref:hypothetical protein n=1 Tax=Sphingomonas sp. NBWT7 TaxID=2596913 RepID=UPI00162AB9F3|nr:hypothetical protein [Sphingomonas sp. NBWT7]QNE32005.1 hypothetical protein F1C10_08680 [Sphingomonas sp. NBWT7]